MSTLHRTKNDIPRVFKKKSLEKLVPLARFEIGLFRSIQTSHVNGVEYFQVKIEEKNVY
jgi:hypothetical protein